MNFGRAVAVLLICTHSIGAQQWTEEELINRAQGFLETDLLSHLTQVSTLVAAEADAGHAIAGMIHGDHREYLLKVERLLEQLTDPRWAKREQAERALIEIGGHAGQMLRQRQEIAPLLEERIRCARIIEEINDRGTERELRQTDILRGLVLTALYMQSDERLTRGLLSALGHTDSIVRNRAVRALGVHGQGVHARALEPMLAQPAHRRAALAAIARMRGDEALELCAGMLAGDELTQTEKVGVIRGLHGRTDSGEVLRAAAGNGDPIVAAAASLTAGQAGDEPRPALITLSDRSSLTTSLRDITADAVVVDSPISGLSQLELAYADCGPIQFDTAPVEPLGTSRVFLGQGSLATGVLRSVDDEHVVLDSTLYGPVQIPRSTIQGIALDPGLDRLIGASDRFDRVRLRDDSIVDGRLDALDSNHATVIGEDGAEQRLPIGDIAGILLRRPPTTPPDNNLYTRIDMATGDRVLGYVADANAASIAVVVPVLGVAQLDVADIAAIELGVAGGALWGFTLIADYSQNLVLEVDESGREVFAIEDVYGAWDVECLDNGNLLITEFSVSRVQEIRRDGTLVWSFEELRNPYDADRLPNGNTLIADTFRGRVIEVDAEGEIVWQYDRNIRPFDADRLANGNTLIADVIGDRVIEVSPEGEIVWEVTGKPSAHDAERLPNGNTLITLRTVSRVVEVDPAGVEVFAIDGLNAPSDADRLPNGNTLVAENTAVREFDRNGNVVWQKQMTWAVEANRY